MLNELSDKEIVDAILSNDEVVVGYFFFEKCAPTFSYVIRHVFCHQVNRNEVINEMYLYLQRDNWRRLRQFGYRSKLTTWIAVVAVNFFKKKRARLMVNKALELRMAEKVEHQEEQIDRMPDVEELLSRLPNEKYRMVIRRLVLEDESPQELANKMGITVDNLYNVKQRALKRLKGIIKAEQHA